MDMSSSICIAKGDRVEESRIHQLRVLVITCNDKMNVFTNLLDTISNHRHIAQFTNFSKCNKSAKSKVTKTSQFYHAYMGFNCKLVFYNFGQPLQLICCSLFMVNATDLKCDN